MSHPPPPMPCTDTGAVFELTGATLRREGAVLFHDATARVRRGGVTCILGPGGTGKSTLLACLAGARPEGVHAEGRWTSPATERGESVALVRQRPRGGAAEGVPWPAAAVLLLDEPRIAPPDVPARSLEEAIAERARAGTVILVTHDLSLARAVSDDVLLLCGGALRGPWPTSVFFDAPPDPLARRFIAQGNAWPSAEEPSLPSHFHWILPAQLAGMGRPGLLRPEEEDLAALAHAGIDCLVSLAEVAPSPEVLRSFGLRGRHFPIPDMGVPHLGRAASLCGEIARALDGGERVAVHCLAGLGRTGTMLACVLVWRGTPASLAVAEVRGVIPRAIQNDVQRDFVDRFADMCGVPRTP